MAITTVSLTHGVDIAASGNTNTGSFTPTANRLVLLCVTCRNPTPNISPGNGNGLTWVQLYDPNIYQLGAGDIGFGVWRAMATTPSTGVISISSNFAYVMWDIVEFSGVDTSGTNGSGAVTQTTQAYSNSGSVDATLSLTGAGNAIFGYCAGRDSSASITPGAGFTTGDTDASGVMDAVQKGQFLASVSQTACNATFTLTAVRMFGFELTAGGGSVPTTGAPSGLVLGAGF